MGEAAGISSSPALTHSDFAALGVTGVTAENLNEVLAALRAGADDGSEIDTLDELRSVVQAAVALSRQNAIDIISRYDGTSSTTAPTLADFSNAGATGVTNTNLASINTAFAEVGITDSDTTAKIQGVVSGYESILSGADGARDGDIVLGESGYLAMGLARIDTSGKASLWAPAAFIFGGDNSLSLTHHQRLTPADCQGHQASALLSIQDDFKRSTRNELSCKDSLRSNASYQALIDNITQIGFLYAQALPGVVPQMQWRTAAKVTDWQAVRGVQICVQTKLSLTRIPTSLACSNGLALSPPSLAWRGIAYLQHASP
jgi:hypothetical protein